MPIPSFLAHAAWMARQIEDVMGQNPEGAAFLRHFPRDMTDLASHSLDIPIIRQPHLSVQNAHEFLCLLQGLSSTNDVDVIDRPLCGLLHIGPPSNLILIDEKLSALLANYVLAHEISHFFSDVFFVQQRWLYSLQEKEPEIKQLFSWQHHNQWLELQALVRGLPPRPTQILERGKGERPETMQREQQADLIAREFLAPWAMIEPLFIQHGIEGITSILRETFGLPKWIAYSYRNILDQVLSPRGDVIDRLFKPLLQNENLAN